MKVFMIGGTGLLGSQAANELINRGHEVKTLSLPPVPKGAKLNKKMEVELGNFVELSDEQLAQKMQGFDAFIFAAGVDERVEGPAPIYDLYKKYNIDPIYRFLGIGQKVGIKKAVILGSYFSYFAKKHPEWKLIENHPYIRARIDQEKAAQSFANDMDVAVLELPYIFGTQPGRKPVWVFLADMILKNKKDSLMYTKGGTTMVTVKQVGEAIAGALEVNKGFNTYPIGYFNMTWTQLLPIFGKAIGKEIKVKTIPSFLYVLGGMQQMKQFKKRGVDSGLNMIKFKVLQTSNLFIDKEEGCDKLGVKDDDIVKAISDSAILSADVALNKVKVIDMKAE
ncbi:MAG: NAD(P)-dependent oxidoreductase [Erysipelotrichaceae bacterium]|jgi:nucleoside-diphosphate-sugar epimerase|nr:NAD(P)-dependent oxidoreductase [Erysipelotrichaceae bacterium]